MPFKPTYAQNLTPEQPETPPGVVKMHANFYVDQTEITNFSYLEFTTWTGMIYGKNSTEFRSIYPDSSSWEQLGPNRIPFFIYYQHPSYRDFPVVCISYDQAKKFSKWRSDRVMEFILIREGIIKWRPSSQTHPDSVFTIERYFTGKYYTIPPHQAIQYYPDYQLPDTSIYYKLELFADSLNFRNGVKCKNDKPCGEEIFICNCKENKNSFSTPEPLKRSSCRKCKKPLIVQLKGNALELTNTPGIGYGGSFDKPCNNTKTGFYTIDTSIFDVGFRNVCAWKKWQ